MSLGPKIGNQPATALPRFAARLADFIVLIPLSYLCQRLFDGNAQTLVTLASFATYEVACIALVGQTLGKRLVGLVVVPVTPGRIGTGPGIGFPHAFVRWLVPAAGSVIAAAWAMADGTGRPPNAVESIAWAWTLVVLVPILWRPDRKGLHDMAAGTMVFPVAR